MERKAPIAGTLQLYMLNWVLMKLKVIYLFVNIGFGEKIHQTRSILM